MHFGIVVDNFFADTIQHLKFPGSLLHQSAPDRGLLGGVDAGKL